MNLNNKWVFISVAVPRLNSPENLRNMRKFSSMIRTQRPKGIVLSDVSNGGVFHLLEGLVVPPESGEVPLIPIEVVCMTTRNDSLLGNFTAPNVHYTDCNRNVSRGNPVPRVDGAALSLVRSKALDDKIGAVVIYLLGTADAESMINGQCAILHTAVESWEVEAWKVILKAPERTLRVSNAARPSCAPAVATAPASVQ